MQHRQVIAAGVLFAICFGCQLPNRVTPGPRGSDDTTTSPRSSLPPTAARQRDYYADLKHGPFRCIADFNTQDQAAIGRVIGPDRRPAAQQPTISLRRCIDDTGAGGLLVPLETPDHQLVIQRARSSQRMPADWRKYYLLLLSISGPPDGAIIELAFESDGDVPLRATRRLIVGPQWQLLRFDLEDLASEIDLSNVRSISLRAPETTRPIELALDDLILADNTNYVLGQTADTGELFVFERGRRIHVGSQDRFSLAFSDGTIVDWRAEKSPNLSAPTGLGPWLVPLDEDWNHTAPETASINDPALFADWAQQYGSTQRILELSAARVVVQGVRQFLPGPGASRDDQRPSNIPQHEWLYTIYPDGRVFVQVTSRARNARWPGRYVGFAIAADARRGFVHIEPPPGFQSNGPATSFVLLAQRGLNRPDLLWSPYEPELAEQQVGVLSPDERQITITIGHTSPASILTTAHMLRFWPPDIEGTPEAYSFAADYQHPPELELLRGKFITNADGDLDGDGYNESQGCFELAADGGLLRFNLLPGPLLRHAGSFRVAGVKAEQCWVYADGRIIENVTRTKRGDVLFTLPRPTSAPVLIELITPRKP